MPAKTPDKNRAAVEKWRAAHPEENKRRDLARKKQWWIDHPEIAAARARDASRKHHQAHPDHSRQRSRIYKARKRNASGSHTREQWAALVAQFDGRCVRCGLKCETTLDHVVPLSKGGSHDISNIQPLCCPCNSSKGARVAIDYRFAPFTGIGVKL